jgi:hypothetical protein
MRLKCLIHGSELKSLNDVVGSYVPLEEQDLRGDWGGFGSVMHTEAGSGDLLAVDEHDQEVREDCLPGDQEVREHGLPGDRTGVGACSMTCG